MMAVGGLFFDFEAIRTAPTEMPAQVRTTASPVLEVRVRGVGKPAGVRHGSGVAVLRN